MLVTFKYDIYKVKLSQLFIINSKELLSFKVLLTICESPVYYNSKNGFIKHITQHLHTTLFNVEESLSSLHHERFSLLNSINNLLTSQELVGKINEFRLRRKDNDFSSRDDGTFERLLLQSFLNTKLKKW